MGKTGWSKTTLFNNVCNKSSTTANYGSSVTEIPMIRESAYSMSELFEIFDTPGTGLRDKYKKKKHILSI